MMNLATVQRLMGMAAREGVTVGLFSSNGHEMGVVFRNAGAPVGATPPPLDLTVQAVVGEGFTVRSLTELGEIFLTL